LYNSFKEIQILFCEKKKKNKTQNILTSCKEQCVIPENIDTHPLHGNWKFREWQGSQKPKILKESMKLNWNS